MVLKFKDQLLKMGGLLYKYTQHALIIITLFRSIIVLCGTDNVLWNILRIRIECKKYYAK
jgi:hypothetical protein